MHIEVEADCQLSHVVVMHVTNNVAVMHATMADAAQEQHVLAACMS